MKRRIDKNGIFHNSKGHTQSNHISNNSKVTSLVNQTGNRKGGISEDFTAEETANQLSKI